MEEFSCRHCHQMVPKSPRHSNQSYCGKADCQRARKRAWYSEKKKQDTDYRMNQHQAQAAWCQKNPHYWKQYRQAHPEVAERNRVLQRLRNQKKRQATSSVSSASLPIAKIDASSPYPIWLLIPPRKQDIAKIDASFPRQGSENQAFLFVIPPVFDCKD